MYTFLLFYFKPFSEKKGAGICRGSGVKTCLLNVTLNGIFPYTDIYIDNFSQSLNTKKQNYMIHVAY